jgi:uncharacterized repeat protein (TIGR03803 family)
MKLCIAGLVAIAVAFTLAAGESRAANLTTLLSFDGTNGDVPRAGLIADLNGNLFGTTFVGGAYGGGTVFEIKKTSSAPTTLHSFCSTGSNNCADGLELPAGLIADANGNLFGTTEYGGANGIGTAFEIVNNGTSTAPIYDSSLKTLVNFCTLPHCADGLDVTASLIADANGNLFGTTFGGGGTAACPYTPSTLQGCGTVYEIKKSPGSPTGYASSVTTLYSFCAQANCTDGWGPEANLIADANGNLFGTTSYGGGASTACPNTSILLGCGTVFELVNNGTSTAPIYDSSPKILVSFCALPNCADGESPAASLIADANGNLFGTTAFGGANGGGTVYEIKKSPGTSTGYASTVTTLYSFCAQTNCADGGGPSGSLIADVNGNLFGTTIYGGVSVSNCADLGGCGTVFEIEKTPGTPTGYASTVTTLYSFCAQANCTDGEEPVASLIADANGNLFGTTPYGGNSNCPEAGGCGTVFKITSSRFIPTGVLAGIPGQTNCIDKSVSGLAQEYGGFAHAAAALGYSVQGLQNEVVIYCGG